VNHLPGLEDAALWVHQGYALAIELEAGGEIGGVDNAATHSREPLHMVERGLTELGVYAHGRLRHFNVSPFRLQPPEICAPAIGTEF
jgi:hypothetical protein